eukprot:10404250-Alexandrium_andersonii.AAC.1
MSSRCKAQGCFHGCLGGVITWCAVRRCHWQRLASFVVQSAMAWSRGRGRGLRGRLVYGGMVVSRCCGWAILGVAWGAFP